MTSTKAPFTLSLEHLLNSPLQLLLANDHYLHQHHTSGTAFVVNNFLLLGFVLRVRQRQSTSSSYHRKYRSHARPSFESSDKQCAWLQHHGFERLMISKRLRSNSDDDDDDESTVFDSRWQINASPLQSSATSSSSSPLIENPPLPSSPVTQRWVLLVDDHPAVRNAVERLLIDNGFQVSAVGNGQQALQTIKMAFSSQQSIRPQSTDSVDNNNNNAPMRLASTAAASTITTTISPGRDDANTQMIPMGNPDPSSSSRLSKGRLPDAIVTEIDLPGMDGISLLRAIRSDNDLCPIPIIVISAKSGPQDRVLGYQSGADAYLPKPFDPQELVTVLNNVLARYDSLNDASRIPTLTDLRRDVHDMKCWILDGGGGGAAVPGWVAATNVFLAPDERTVLELLCDGRLSNKDIAVRTFLSTRRVEQLLTSMFRKAKVKNRTELVRWAIATGTVKI